MRARGVKRRRNALAVAWAAVVFTTCDEAALAFSSNPPSLSRAGLSVEYRKIYNWKGTRRRSPADHSMVREGNASVRGRSRPNSQRISPSKPSKILSLSHGDDSLDQSRDENIAEKLLKLPQQTKKRLAAPSNQGLSRFHQSILSQSADRQRCVTGKYPMHITVQENPTRKWLGIGRGPAFATAQLFINGTTVDRSLASFGRFQWIDDDERQELSEKYNLVSLELLAEIHLKKPGYVNVLPAHGAGSSAAVQRGATDTAWNLWKRNSLLYEQLEDDKWQAPYRDRIWVTGFSLARKHGYLHSIDADTGHIESVDSRTTKSIRWPNESSLVPLLNCYHNQDDVRKEGKLTGISDATIKRSKRADDLDDALLISDGFLVPGKDKGGLYLVKNPGNDKLERNVCLTGGSAESESWFYHRAVWIDLTGDGRKSILTARAKPPSVLSSNGSRSTDSSRANESKIGQLVWVEMPKPHSIDKATGTPLERDGTVFDPLGARHIPWKIHVLDEGPDVMFAVADLDPNDNTIEIIASQFFQRRVTLHSIYRGPQPQITFRRTLDDQCGAAFGAILADFKCENQGSHDRSVIDSGSTVPTQKPRDTFSHLLVTSHECSFDDKSAGGVDNGRSASTEKVEGEGDKNVKGGSLFAYRVPDGKNAWKTKPWIRTTVASGFRVKGQLGNVINPGAPGFVYTFYSRKDDDTSGKRPLIAVAGDCAESAYIFRPVAKESDPKGHFLGDPCARYELMCEIETGATVGSIGIGYSNFCPAEQQSGYAKLYIPCYEKDKIYVFAMGDGDDEHVGLDNADDGW